mgnify:CR=1 FL=1|tara:strand:+ start:87 stop:1976 length:1890 start_codon:yes stop_codon:yes gene_type:complete
MRRVQIKGTDQTIGFPDDMDEEQMLQVMRSQFSQPAPAGQNVSDALKPKQNYDQTSVVRKAFNQIAEPAAAIVSSALAEPISGLLSLPVAFGRDIDQAVKAQKNIQEWMTYVPKTKEGMESLQTVADLLQPIAEVMELTSKTAGDAVFKYTGNPELATIAYSAPTALLEVLGLKGVRSAAKSGYLGKEMDVASMASGDGVNPGLKSQIGAVGNVSAKRTGDVLLDRLIDTGFLNGDIVTDKTIKKAVKDYTATKRDNRRFAAKEDLAKANDYATKIQSLTDKSQRIIITPEDLLNEVLVGTKGDKQLVGNVNQVGGMNIENSVYAHGGLDYTLFNQGKARSLVDSNGKPIDLDAEFGVGWASAKSIADGRQKAYLQAAEMTGKNPLAAYSSMGDQAIDFATPVSEIMLAQAKTLDIPAQLKNKFDDELRALFTTNKKTGKVNMTFPNWVGIDHPKSAEQLKTLGGKERKAFARLMAEPKYRAQGFPLYHEAIGAITEDRLRNTPTFGMGAQFFDTDPNAKSFPTNDQSSYDAGIPMQQGGRIMGLKNDYPLEIMMPDAFGEMKKKRDKKGKIFTDAFAKTAVLDSSLGNDFYQVVDEKVVDKMLEYDKKRSNDDPYQNINRTLAGDMLD